MWIYEKKLQFPVKIKNPNPKIAGIIVSQLGGPDGEVGASMRYLQQRYTCPYDKVTGILTDVGTEELAHVEMVSTILFQLLGKVDPEEWLGTPFGAYFVDHTTGVYPTAAAGVPFDAKGIGVKGDILADLHDLAGELVAGHPGIGHVGVRAAIGIQIAAADAAVQRAKQGLVLADDGLFDLQDLHLAGLDDGNGFHGESSFLRCVLFHA